MKTKQKLFNSFVYHTEKPLLKPLLNTCIVTSLVLLNGSFQKASYSCSFKNMHNVSKYNVCHYERREGRNGDKM